MKTSILLAATVGIVSFVCANGRAAPAISGLSGTVSHGQSIILAGSGFGAHANYNEGGYQWRGASPLAAKFKDFEDGSKTSGGWYDAFPAQNSVAVGGRVAGGKYLKEMFVSDERTQVQYDMSRTTGEFYVSFWFMIPPSCQSGKFFRIYGSGGAANVYLSTGGGNSQIRGYSECTSSGCSPETEWGTGSGFVANTWHRVEIYMNQSPNTFTTYLDGVLQWSKNDWMGNPFGGNGHSMDFGNMIDGPERGGGTAGSYNYDDVFVDYTQARVELCEGATWSNRGRCEVQVPTAWAATSLAVAVNVGTFASGASAYLYVVDSTGSVNGAGYPVSIDAGSAPAHPRPSPPTNLVVQ